MFSSSMYPMSKKRSIIDRLRVFPKDPGLEKRIVEPSRPQDSVLP